MKQQQQKQQHQSLPTARSIANILRRDFEDIG